MKRVVYLATVSAVGLMPLLAQAQTYNLDLGSVTDDGGSNSFDNHYGFGGNETNLPTGETQHYTPGNVSTGANGITLTANPDGTAGAITSGTEYYGMPTTGGFTLDGYGTLNVKATVPYGANLWPALWLEPVTSASNPTPAPCEIDFMEAPFNTASKYQASLHDGGAGYTTGVNVGNLTGENTYGVNITASTINYLLNGRTVGSVATPDSCKNQKFYLLANVAEGGWASQYASGQPTASGAMTISGISFTPSDGGSATGGLIGVADPTVPVGTQPGPTIAATAAGPVISTGGSDAKRRSDRGPDGRERHGVWAGLYRARLVHPQRRWSILDVGGGSPGSG